MFLVALRVQHREAGMTANLTLASVVLLGTAAWAAWAVNFVLYVERKKPLYFLLAIIAGLITIADLAILNHVLAVAR